MNYRKITAIIRIERADDVIDRLKSAGIPGMSCTHIKGYGEYPNFYSTDRRVEPVEHLYHVKTAEESRHARH